MVANSVATAPGIFAVIPTATSPTTMLGTSVRAWTSPARAAASKAGTLAPAQFVACCSGIGGGNTGVGKGAWLAVGLTAPVAPLPGMTSAAAMSLTASSKLGSRTLWWSGLAPPYCARGCSLALAMPRVLHRGTVRASMARCTSVAVAKEKVHVVGSHLTLSAMNTSSIVRKRPGSVQPRRTRRFAARRSFLRIVFSASRARATHR
mmetsp:Transcript_50024/g.68294  ORF Transcript_50024/g.68294 Transcript_50024/m.68294 type:complete len:206 (-) Transcript_50024:451-1068(-)